MNVIDVKEKIQFIIKSTLLIPEELLNSQIIKGDYLLTFTITPIIFIENIKIRNKDDIFKIATSKKIYNQKFVLARIYIYIDDTENHISFYFDGFPWSYVLENVKEETRKKIDNIYDEEIPFNYNCIKDEYQLILDQISRMIEILLDFEHLLKITMRWAAIEALNPQNKIK
ncbi:MAG: hypothetical protein ACFFAH_14295 [Promethearchaeota archaeon]